jgi:hypothetical protein
LSLFIYLFGGHNSLELTTEISSFNSASITDHAHPPHGVISFNCKCERSILVFSILASIVTTKFIKCTILFSFSEENFKLEWRGGLDLGCHSML